MEHEDTRLASPDQLAAAHATLVERLPIWKCELQANWNDVGSTYWFGVMSKAIALCEIVVAGCGQHLLGRPDEKKRTMGQWVNVIKGASSKLPASVEGQEAFLILLTQMLTLRNDFVHRAFTVSGVGFALEFLDYCEQFADSEVVVHMARPFSDPA